MSSPCGVLGEATADRCAWRSLRYLAAINAAGVGPSGADPRVVEVGLALPRAGVVGGCARGGRGAPEVAREFCCWWLPCLIVEDEDVDEAETEESLEE